MYHHLADAEAAIENVQPAVVAKHYRSVVSDNKGELERHGAVATSVMFEIGRAHV